MNPLITVCIILLVIIIIAYVILTLIQRKKNAKNARAKSLIPVRSSKLWYFFDNFFRKFFITRKYYSKVKKKVELVTPADNITVTRIAAKNMFFAFIAAIISLVILLISGPLDIFYLMICVLGVYVIFTHTMNSKLEKQDYMLLKQFTSFLSSIRHYYHQTASTGGTGVVDEAVYETIDHVPYEMGLHASRIYEILNSNDVELETQKYNEVAPNRFIMTFLAICTTVLKYGDKKSVKDGQSIFLKNLDYLKQEVNMEILKREKMNRLFMSLVWIAVIPMFTLKFIENWACNSMPEMADYFIGPMGVISMIIIFLQVIISYTMINRLKDSQDIEQKDHALLERIGEIPIIKRFLTREINKRYTHSLVINDALKSIGERMGPNLFLLKRILFSIVGIILFNLAIFTINFNLRKEIVENYEKSFETSIITNEMYRVEMKKTCEEYVNLHKDDKPSYEVLLKDIMSGSEIRNKSYAEMVTTEVLERIDEYNSVYYKWYYVLIALVVAVIAFETPLIMLKYRQYIMRLAMEDEVIQYNTLILILMHIDRMSVDIILEWMERFAFSFKQSISECIQDLEMGDTKALEEMKNKESFEPFKQLVDNLIAIDKVNVANAFDEIESEREYHKDKRKEDNEYLAKNKALIGQALAFASIITVALFYLILPFILMAVKQYNSFSSYLNF